MNRTETVKEFAFIRPIDVVKLIRRYGKNRVETINITKNIWYKEGVRLQPIYRSNLKLFMQDVQLVLNLLEEDENEVVAMELQNTTGKNMKDLMDYPPDHNAFGEMVQYFKNYRLLLLYFPEADIYKKRYNSIFINVLKMYSSKALIVDRIKECLKIYSLEMLGAKNKLIDVEYTRLEFRGFVTCRIKGES